MTNFMTLPVAIAAAGIAMAGLSGQAMAQDHGFTYERTGPGGGHGRNLIEFFEFNYGVFGEGTAHEKNLFSATMDFKPEVVKNGGFWLVLSDGPNPKGHVREYAIMYGDLERNRLSIFEYNGQNNSNSLNNPGRELADIRDAFTLNKQDGIVEFELDVTSINALDFGSKWDGIEFGEKIGVWFHFGDDLHQRYKNGKLTQFSLPGQGWVDFKDGHADKVPPCELFPGGKGCDPTEVSEPGSLALIGMGLVGLAASRRRKA